MNIRSKRSHYCRWVTVALSFQSTQQSERLQTKKQVTSLLSFSTPTTGPCQFLLISLNVSRTIRVHSIFSNRFRKDIRIISVNGLIPQRHYLQRRGALPWR